MCMCTSIHICMCVCACVPYTYIYICFQLFLYERDQKKTNGPPNPQRAEPKLEYWGILFAAQVGGRHHKFDPASLEPNGPSQSIQLSWQHWCSSHK